MDNGVTNLEDVYVCVVMLFVQKWYLSALLTIILYSPRLSLLLERYVYAKQNYPRCKKSEAKSEAPVRYLNHTFDYKV